MRRVLVASVLSLGTILGHEAHALACGGCFHPPPSPTESPTVVTDHRMILSISQDQSTLYDQIRYSGSPSSFAWVLPIAGTVKVGLSSDSVFKSLEQITATVLTAPPRNCPNPPTNCSSSSSGASTSSSSGGFGAGGAADAGVSVIKEETVGPYLTVQLQSTDANALENWLTQNGFSIPTEVQPVISAYVNEKFNFLALKLLPNKGVQDMRPVRVTTSGAGPTLPLRMVAAGTGATVGITLWIIAEGRYEPQNFASFYIDTNDIIWDWNLEKSNYTDLRNAKTAAGNGRIWETESSIAVVPSYVDGFVGDYDYLPEKDDQGNVVKTAAQVHDDDVETLFHGIPTSTARVTRLRADLAHAALDQDMAMTASADQKVLSNDREITKEANEPLCPVYSGCTQTGSAPRGQAGASSGSTSLSATGGTFSCTTSTLPEDAWIVVALGFLGFAGSRAARRRRL